VAAEGQSAGLKFNDRQNNSVGTLHIRTGQQVQTQHSKLLVHQASDTL
jgi:hypothetical protein